MIKKLFCALNVISTENFQSIIMEEADTWLKSKHCLEKQDGSSTPSTILKIVIADLLRRCLLSHHCFQEHWIACIPEGDV